LKDGRSDEPAEVAEPHSVSSKRKGDPTGKRRIESLEEDEGIWGDGSAVFLTSGK